ncbi:hypothetical protein [Parasphaerochaeta coccoides]|uniref:Uncharacterized protein n=1 Tax=Parasphaerochaeta coccoides (strain ATCC BAA-1237 / DSM 17374 / SPN1) TaxID=760011 RepID=F4GK22_PARC1|nr:hypothetical protein [Parasphaerochaeta coccoides]AEC01794.1 hypothetical protein Spico_0566 [Parasphaerochaeta coccoides DSM 17374]
MKTIQGIVKINLKQSKLAYLIAGIVFFATAVSDIITRVILRIGSGMALGNYLLILPLLMGIFIPAINFSKLLNLGCKRLDFFKGCLPTYALASFCTTLVCLVLWLFHDPFMLPFSSDPSLYNLFDVFGFAKNGEMVAFIQMFTLLLLTSCAAHTLTLVQGHWYGWLADVLIVAVIAVFTPIAPLRATLSWFFDLIIFNNLAIVQILSCVVLSVAVYATGLVPIREKQI